MAAEQINAELLAALQWFEQFHRREGEDWTDSFERVAAAFHGDTGYLRPGKDCRVHDSDVRQAAWEKWVAKHVDKARDTIADAIAMSEVRHG